MGAGPAVPAARHALLKTSGDLHTGSAHCSNTYPEPRFLTAQGGVFTRAGVAQTFAGLGAGDAGFAPRGSAHWLRNTNPTDAFVVLIFNGGTLTTVDIGGLIGTLPADMVATSLNVTQAFVKAVNPRLAAMVPAMAAGNATRSASASAGRR